MTFQDANNFLLSLSNLRRQEYMNDARQCSVYLKRLQLFLDILGNPEKRIPHYIHVAGTSGKGSVTSYLHTILAQAGYKAGATFSPHPSVITQRWRIGKRDIYQKELASLVEEIIPALDKYNRVTPYDMLSFFEVTEAIGLLWFARNNVEWLVLETACGGRYDSSNVIPHKDVAIITNIGLDHVGIIGNNLREIAKEKAGIIKKGSQVITAETKKNICAILAQECKKAKTTLKTIKKPTHIQVSLDGTEFSYKNKRYTASAPGMHQARNAALCIDVCESLGISSNAIARGLQTAPQPLRMEVVQERPTIILDAAHNPDKIKSTVATIQHLKPNGSIHLVIGCSENKNLGPMMKALATLHPASVACTRNTMNVFRKVASPHDIAKKIKHLLPQSEVETFLSPDHALRWSRKRTKKYDLLLITGSVFLSGELRPHFVRS